MSRLRRDLLPVFEWLLKRGAGDPGRMPESVYAAMEWKSGLVDYITSTEMKPEWCMRDIHRVVKARALKWLPAFLHETADYLVKPSAQDNAGRTIEHVARVFLFLDLPAERNPRELE